MLLMQLLIELLIYFIVTTHASLSYDQFMSRRRLQPCFPFCDVTTPAPTMKPVHPPTCDLSELASPCLLIDFFDQHISYNRANDYCKNEIGIEFASVDRFDTRRTMLQQVNKMSSLILESSIDHGSSCRIGSRFNNITSTWEWEPEETNQILDRHLVFDNEELFSAHNVLNPKEPKYSDLNWVISMVMSGTASLRFNYTLDLLVILIVLRIFPRLHFFLLAQALTDQMWSSNNFLSNDKSATKLDQLLHGIFLYSLHIKEPEIYAVFATLVCDINGLDYGTIAVPLFMLLSMFYQATIYF